MDPSGILEIIKAFFNAIRGVLVAMGILKEDAAADKADDKTE